MWYTYTISGSQNVMVSRRVLEKRSLVMLVLRSLRVGTSREPCRHQRTSCGFPLGARAASGDVDSPQNTKNALSPTR